MTMRSDEERPAGTGRHGRFLGIPYDFRQPGWRPFIARVWNADEDRIFSPMVFGVGWAINLHAVLRRTHLIGRHRE